MVPLLVIVFGCVSVGLYFVYDLCIHFIHLLETIMANIRIDRLLSGFIRFGLDLALQMTHTLAWIGYHLSVTGLNVASQVFTILLRTLPTIFQMAKTGIGFSYWTLHQLWRGIMTRDCQFLTSISWTMVFCALNMYIQRLFGIAPNNQTNRAAHQPSRQINQGIQIDTNQHQPNPPLGGHNLYPNLNRFVHEQHENEETNQNAQNIAQEIRYRPRDDTREDNFDNNLCVVCMENPRNVVTFPCGHVQLCSECVSMILRRNKLCPVCQARITEHRHVFL